MKKRLRESQLARLPMVELIVSIGIFAVLSVFLMEMFLAANSLSQKARDEGKAITLAETIAETIKTADCEDTALEEIGAGTKWACVESKEDGSSKLSNILDKETENSTKVYVLHYDKKWNKVDKEDAYSVILVPFSSNVQDKIIENYSLYVYRLDGYPSLLHYEKNVELFQLNFSKYRR